MFLSFPSEAHFLEIEGDFVAQAAAERQTEEDIKVALRSVIVRRDDDVGLRRDADGQAVEADVRLKRDFVRHVCLGMAVNP